MRIYEMNWMQVEAYLAEDDRAVLPLGCTEQHAYLSLGTDSILADRVAVEAAEPLGIPVFPAVAYGLTPYFMAYPGTITLRVETYRCLIRDLLDSLTHHGFRRILIVNGHGGNSPARAMIGEWLHDRGDRPTPLVKFHDWWNAPQVWARVQAIDPRASHASWMENFPWTRLPGVTLPETAKSMPGRAGLSMLTPPAAREYYGDGNFDGLYQRSDEEMLAIWQVAVAETRALLTDGW